MSQTPSERREAELATNRTLATEAFGGSCVCCGSQADETFMFVVRLGNRLKMLEPTAATLAAIVRRPPANSEMRCGNCYATFNNTGECQH